MKIANHRAPKYNIKLHNLHRYVTVMILDVHINAISPAELRLKQWTCGGYCLVTEPQSEHTDTVLTPGFEHLVHKTVKGK